VKQGRAKKKPSGKDRDRRKKKALSGPRKPAKNKRAQRRAMIAARRRRRASLSVLALRWSRRVDRRVDRLLVRAEPVALRAWADGRRGWTRWSRRLRRWARPVYVRAGRLLRWTGRRLRPLGVLVLRLLGLAERRTRRSAAWAVRAATRASAVVSPERAICAVIVASAACLLVAQFVDYRAVEVGGPGYAGLPESARAPTVDGQAPIDAHSYLLVAVSLLAAGLAVAAARRRRPQLGRVVFVLGLFSAALVLLVDRAAGLDAGSQASLFSGATAVLEEGFYAELAAAGGLMLGGALLVLAPKAAARYHARPCRTRTNLYARAASGLRRRRRRRASSRGRGARRPSPRPRGEASAPASQP
jgi:hypothetical protein